MRHFGDLTIGEERISAAITLDEAEVIAFAEQYDPQYFHTDPAAACGSAFGGLIASGVHTIALWRRLDHAINGDIAFHCGLALEDVRFRRAVRPGDALRLSSKLVMLADSANIPASGVATLDYVMRNQDDVAALTLRSVSLVYR